MAYTKYSLTPANNNAAPPDGAPEGMLPSGVNNTMRDMMSQIRDCGDGIRGGTYTMTAPVITGGTITGVALSGNTFTNPVVTGGSINNTPIGATTANTGAFTSLSITGAFTLGAGGTGTSGQILMSNGNALPSYVSTGNATANVGYLNVPQNSQSSAYTLVIGDSGKHIYHPSSDTTARIWTIPANSSVAFPIGTVITFVNDFSAGAITLSITSDTLVYTPDGSTGSRTLAAGAVATVIKVTSTRWIISGTKIS